MTYFHFRAFEPTGTLKSFANRSLDRILRVAPYGTISTALLEKIETGFQCSVELYSSRGPFIASTVRLTPEEAITCLEKKLIDQMNTWWLEHRDTPNASIPEFAAS